MHMKSVLAISALSAATFLASVAYAADANPAKQTADKASAQKVQTQDNQAAEATAPAAAYSTATADESAKAQPKKRASHKKHKKHKKHRKQGGHQRHHHYPNGHHHHHYHDFYHSGDVYQDIPSWNFLVGGSLGYAAQKSNFTTRFVNGAFAPGLISQYQYRDHSEKITESGVMMSVLGGWQWHCKRWMLGAEGNVDFSSFEKVRFFAHTDEYTPQAYTGSVLYDRGDILGLTGRVGYFVTPFFMPYVRLGAQMSRDEVSYQVITSPTQAPDFSSRKKDVYGFVAGVGAEFPTYIGASTIRFEYNFTKTESVIIEDNFLPVVGNHKFRYPETHIGKIAWVWNFM